MKTGDFGTSPVLTGTFWIAERMLSPSVIKPNTEWLKSRKRVDVAVMKNCESFVSSVDLAIDRMPLLVCWSWTLNSSSNLTPLPPVPLPDGSPPWITNGLFGEATR